MKTWTIMMTWKITLWMKIIDSRFLVEFFTEFKNEPQLFELWFIFKFLLFFCSSVFIIFKVLSKFSADLQIQ